ncbi:PapB/FocB family fimbrial expression transcriptional regulator [Escherichia coli]
MKRFWSTYVSSSSVILPGKMDKELFHKLIGISGIHSQKVVLALKDYCVNGYDRKQACDRNNVSYSYFSVSLKRLQLLNKSVIDIIPYYMRFLTSSAED